MGDVDEKSTVQFCRDLKYEKFPPGQYVFLKGDVSNDKLYVILSGRVGVVIPKEEDNFIQIENQRKLERKSTKINEKFMKEREIQMKEQKEKEKEMKEKEPKEKEQKEQDAAKPEEFSEYKGLVMKKLFLKKNTIVRKPTPNVAENSTVLTVASNDSLLSLSQPPDAEPKPAGGFSLKSILLKEVGASPMPKPPSSVRKEIPIKEPSKNEELTEVKNIMDILTMGSKGFIKRNVINGEGLFFKALIGGGNLSARSNMGALDNDPEEFKDLIEQQGRLVKDLITGEMFGDLALINSKPRTASILTMEPSEFIILMKKDFDKFKKFYNRENVEKRKYMLENLPHLNEIVGENLISNFEMHCEPRKFLRGHKVVVEGFQPEHLYIVKEGNLILEKEITAELLNAGRHPNKPEYIVPQVNQVNLTNLGEGSIIGEECLFFGMVANFTVKVKSMQCMVYQIQSRNLLKNYPLVMIDTLKKRFKEKQQHRLQIFEAALNIHRTKSVLSETPTIHVPTTVDSIKDILNPRVRNKIIHSVKTTELIDDIQVQCPEYFLIKDSSYRDKLKNFYGKYTRKMDHYILTATDGVKQQ